MKENKLEVKISKENKITFENIKVLKENEIFVYGDNLAHIHGAGAALQALKFGAIHGKGLTIIGNTYGIPTKDSKFNVLNLEEIKNQVDFFIENVLKANPDKIFLITKIGTGLSGYKNSDIAPLFKKCLEIENCTLPLEFIQILNNN